MMEFDGLQQLIHVITDGVHLSPEKPTVTISTDGKLGRDMGTPMGDLHLQNHRFLKF